MFSAGDVLLELRLENADAADKLVLLRNGSHVSSVLQTTATDPLRLLGVVDGLSVSENTISANIGNTITVVNYPSGGAVFTGPHIQAWVCQDGAAD
jgi:hypothetical protein